MTMDRKRNWLLSGTSKGVLSLWDIRFQTQLKSWTHPANSPITNVLPYPRLRSSKSSQQGKNVCISIGSFMSEISTWDVDIGSCNDVFCVLEEPSQRLTNITEVISSVYNTGLKVCLKCN
jgi:phosphoinositide-3-kinase regulatory subunit 4